jgi:chromosomal replication initiation ATPase DnaA
MTPDPKLTAQQAGERDLRAEFESAGIIMPRGERDQLITQALQLVAEDHGIKVKDLRGHARSKRFCRARRDAYAALRYLGLSLPEIGRALRKDHTTVLAGLRKREAALVGARLKAEAFEALDRKLATLGEVHGQRQSNAA